MIIMEIFTSKQEKIAETYQHTTTEFLDLMKKKQDELNILKNYSVYQQVTGQYGKFYIMFEVDSFADFEKIMTNMRNDKDLRRYLEEWPDLIIDGSYSIELLKKIA